MAHFRLSFFGLSAFVGAFILERHLFPEAHVWHLPGLLTILPGAASNVAYRASASFYGICTLFSFVVTNIMTGVTVVSLPP